MAFSFLSRFSFKSLKLKLILITVEQKEVTGNEDILREIAATEQLLSTLVSIPEPFVFETAVHHTGTHIHFYLAVPKERVPFAIQQIEGVFSTARAIEVKDYTIFGANSKVKGGYLVQKESSLLPIRTYEDSGADTFAPILNNFAKLDEVGDGAVLQILVRPAHESFKKIVRDAIGKLKEGKKLNDILKESILRDIGKSLLGKDIKQKEKEEKLTVDENAIKTLESKISKPLLSVNVRILTSAENEDKAEDLLMSIAGSFSQFSSPERNEFKVVKPSKLKKLVYQYTFREYDNNHEMTLNTEEVASIFHIPTITTNISRIKWLETKEAPPPQQLEDSTREGIILGDSIFHGDKKAVLIQEDDRRRHFYIVGQTGTGKSALIKSLAVQDIKNGKGVCIIDPNGDLVDDVLSAIPNDRVNDVIVFDPGNISRPLGLNMIEHDLTKPEQKTFIVNEMQSIFNRLFSQETMGPMFEQYMRNALLLLMEDAREEPATLVEVPRVFTDSGFRERKLSRISNPLVVDFWTKEATKAGGEASLQNMTPYITSKFNNFIANDYMRPIIGQTKSAFSFRNIMDDGKILLVKLAKGRIGDINANLLGMIITGKLLMAALGRDDIPENERKDFYFYIDEFQNFTTDSIATILAEARKYKLNLTIAHQYIAQLEDNIREAVFGNIGTILSFRVGVEDAEELEKQFSPEFSVKDLINIENLNGVIRLLVNGHPTKPFNIKIRFAERGSPEVREKLMELSGLTYGKNLSDIENDIMRRLRA